MGQSCPIFEVVGTLEKCICANSDGVKRCQKYGGI